MKIRNICAFLLLLVVTSSCTVSSEDVRIDGMGGVELVGVTLSQARLILKMTVANDSRARLTVRNGQLTVRDEKGEIARIAMDEEVVLKKKTATEIALPLTVRFTGGLGSVSAIPRLSADPGNLLLDGEIRVRGGSLGRKLKIQNMPLDDFLEMLGAANGDILNL